jgi:hypothetical protein
MTSAPARLGAVACVLDDPPAATLLLPYFEIDVANPSGATTLFSVLNTGAPAVLVNVTLWTDWGVPTFAFPIYLTGFDVETVNLRDIFEGRLPATASLGQDLSGFTSPKGTLSEDIDIDSCDGLLPPPALQPAFAAELRRAHQGLSSTLLGAPARCSGAPIGDGRARGYVTIDLVNGCSTTATFPSDTGYWGVGGRAASRNVLSGDVFQVDPAQNAADGASLVRIEAFPGRFAPGTTTFYGRFPFQGQQPFRAIDDREPLATLWATRFVQGGAFNGGSKLVVWRDPGVQTASVECGTQPTWRVAETLVAFDEQESVAADEGCNILCPPRAYDPNFPRVAQKIGLDDLGIPENWTGIRQPIPFDFGWAALTFYYPPLGNPAQAWVGLELSAEGRFRVSETATPIDSSCGELTQFPIPFQ